MIVWLASYPRSGNTALRVLLNRVFGLETLSLYDDRTDIGASEERARLVGHRSHGRTAEAFAAEAAASAETFYVKTHELPPAGQDWPAIVVVRDGRSAIVSYWHYRNRFGGTATTLKQVVTGDVMFGSWSAHVAAWLDAPLSRRLVLRYEEVASLTPETVARISDFLGVEPKGIPADLGFAAARTAFPEFFRSGDDTKNIAELEATTCSVMFEALHGPLQRRIGYPPVALPVDAAAVLAVELDRVLALRRQHAAEAQALRDQIEALRREHAAEAEALRDQIEALRRQHAAEAQALRREHAAEAEALRDQINALRNEIDGMRNSPFWKLRGATIRTLGAVGLRRRSWA